jgi:hypothetical protein
LKCPLCDAAFLAESVISGRRPAPPDVVLDDADDVTHRSATPALLAFGARLDELVGDPLRWSSNVASEQAKAASADSNSSRTSSDLTDRALEKADSDATRHERTVDKDDVSTHPPAESVGTFKAAARPRSQSTFAGAVGQLIGIVVFGIIGLSLGYLVLLWLQGPKGDILKIRDKLPRWMTPGDRGDKDAPDSHLGSAKPARESRTKEESADERGIGHASASGADRSVDGANDLPEFGEGAPNELATDDGEDEDRPLGPLQFAPHAPAELAAALSKVHAALGCEHCGGTGFVRQTFGHESAAGAVSPGTKRVRCEHCDGRPSGKLTIERFDELCDLAELATFTRIERTEPAWDVLRDEALRVLQRVGDDHDKAQVAGRLAGPRLDDSRRQSNGILLAGTIHDTQPEGPLFRTRIVLFGRPRTVTVLSLVAPSPPLAAHDRVIVLGSIIDSPRDNLGGYAGDLPQVVWGGLALKLD